MRIAVPSRYSQLSEEINDCRSINVYTVQNLKIENEQELIPPQNPLKHLPEFLHKNHIDLLITGKVSPDLVEELHQKKIKAITGAPGGPARMLVEIYALQNDEYVKGEL